MMYVPRLECSKFYINNVYIILKMAYNNLRLFPFQKSPRSHLLSEHGVIEDQEVEKAAKADAMRLRGPPDHK